MTPESFAMAYGNQAHRPFHFEGRTTVSGGRLLWVAHSDRDDGAGFTPGTPWASVASGHITSLESALRAVST